MNVIFSVVASFLLLASLIKSESDNLIKNQLVYSFAERYRVRHCIIVSGSEFKTHKSVKFLAMRGISTSSVAIEKFPSAPKKSVHQLLIVMNLDFDIDIGEVGKVIKKTFPNVLVSGRFVWLFFAPSLEKINSLKVPYDCRFFVVELKQNEGSFTVWASYTYEVFSWIELIGVWTLGGGLQVSEGDVLNSRRNMNGLVNLKSLTLRNLCATRKIDCQIKEVWDIFQDVFNFTVIGSSGPTYVPGRALEVMVAPQPMVERSITMTVGPVFNLRVYMFLRQIRKEHSSNAYLRPFHANVWTFVILWIIFSSLSFVILNVIHLKSKDEKFQHYFWEFIFAPIYTLCNQESPGLPCNTVNRIIVISTRLVAMCIVMHYSSFLLSYLMVTSSKLPFNSMEELVKDGSYKSSVLTYSFEIEDLENKFPEVKPVKVWTDMNEAREKLCTDSVSFVGMRDTVFRESADCIIKKAENPVFTAAVGFTLFRLELYTFFEKKLTTLREIGIIDKMLGNIEGKNDEIGDSYEPVIWEQVSPIQRCLGTLMLICFGVALVEVLFSSKRKFSALKNRINVRRLRRWN